MGEKCTVNRIGDLEKLLKGFSRKMPSLRVCQDGCFISLFPSITPETIWVTSKLLDFVYKLGGIPGRRIGVGR